jgi:hypothetical protein
LFAGRFKKIDAAGLHGVIVAPEVVSVKKEKDAAAGLVANGVLLFGRSRRVT